MKRTLANPALLLTLLLPMVAAPLRSQAIAFGLKKDSVAKQLKVVSGKLAPDSVVKFSAHDTIAMHVVCDKSISCASIHAKVDLGAAGKPLAFAEAAKGDSMTFTRAASDIPESAAGNLSTYAVVVSATDSTIKGVTPFKVARPPVDAAGAGAPTTAGKTIPAAIGNLLTRDCSPWWPNPLNTNPTVPLPAQKQSLGQLFVAPSGSVLALPPEHFKEGDVLQVNILADPALTSVLGVVRTSAILNPNAIVIAGDQVNISQTDLNRLQSTGGAAPANCKWISLYAYDFAAPKGVVQIQAQLSDGSLARVGSPIEFAVEQTYVGGFSLGAIRSNLGNPAYALRWNGADSVIYDKTGANPRLLYALMFTPYIWGKRSLAQPGIELNPVVGTTLTDIGKNAIFGLTLDVNGLFYLSWGGHIGMVSELVPSAKLAVDSTFSGPSTAIPTHTHLGVGQFWGITLDLRAAASFLKVISGATAGAAAAASP